MSREVTITTPWGLSERVIPVCEGIDFVETAGHGGYRLCADLWEQMPGAWRETKYSRSGFYEEDYDWGLVALRFPFVFVGNDPLVFESVLGAVEYLGEQLASGLEELRRKGSECVRAWATIPALAHLA